MDEVEAEIFKELLAKEFKQIFEDRKEKENDLQNNDSSPVIFANSISR